MSSLDDVIALEQLLSRYGQIMDTANWPDLREVLSPDIVWDSFAFQLHGLDAVVARFYEERHPRSHHTTNLQVELDPPDRATVRSKWLTVRAGGTFGTGDYLDTAIRTPEGWRITHRVLTQRGRSL
jgi:SnoaL-like domain